MSTERNRRISQAVKDGSRRLMQFIRARVRSEADAEDVMQEVWQQFVAALDSGPIDQVSSWLYTVARNRIIDRYRKPQMTSLDALVDEEEDDDGLDFAAYFLRESATPRTEHLRNLFWECLHEALSELPEEQRQVFALHELEGFSFQEIADLTGENVNTLLSRKRYAVLHLRERLEPLRAEFLESEP